MLESWCVSLLFTFVSQNIQLVFRERERQRERELVLGLVTGGDSLGFELLQRERERERDLCGFAVCLVSILGGILPLYLDFFF